MANGDYSGYDTAPDSALNSPTVGSPVVTPISGGSVNPVELNLTGGATTTGLGTPPVGPETTLHKLNINKGLAGFSFGAHLYFQRPLEGIFVQYETLPGFVVRADSISYGLNAVPNFGFGALPAVESGWYMCELLASDAPDAAVLFRQRVDWTWTVTGFVTLSQVTGDLIGNSFPVEVFRDIEWDYIENVTTTIVDGNDFSNGGSALDYLDNGWTSETNTDQGRSTIIPPIDIGYMTWETLYRSAPYRMWVPPTAVIKMTYAPQKLGTRTPINRSYWLNPDWPRINDPDVQRSAAQYVSQNGSYAAEFSAAPDTSIIFNDPGDTEMQVNLSIAQDAHNSAKINYTRGWDTTGIAASRRILPFTFKQQTDKIGALVDPANQVGVASITRSDDGLHVAYTRYENTFFAAPNIMGQVPDRTAYASIDEDAYGNLYILARDIDNGWWNFYKSTDSGRTWTQMAQAAWSSDYEQANFLIGATGTMHAVAMKRADSHIYYVSSADEGQTWTTPVMAYGGAADVIDQSAPQLVEGSDGELRIVIHNGPIQLSKDSGKTWEPIPNI